jgi:hypothetical protein
MPAYQIQVRGELDGSTPFAIPTDIPAPSDGGVIKIDAGDGVNVGTIDVNALALTDGTPVWLRAIHVEYAALTRAARISADVSGSRQPDLVVPDIFQSNAAPIMRPSVLAASVLLPVGTELDILTDDTDDTFAGSPVAGPHFIYLDVEPVRDDEQMGLIQNLASIAQQKAESEGESFSSSQLVAATLSEDIGVVGVPSKGDDSQQAQLQSATVVVGTAVAAGESMVITLQRVIRDSGATQDLATVTLDDTITANSRTVIPILNSGNVGMLNGDTLRVVRTYTAGGGPTMTTTFISATIAPIQLS